MRLMTSVLDRILDSLAQASPARSRRARHSVLQHSVLEALEPRQLMDGALQLFWVQTGGTSSAISVDVSNLDYQHHWVVADNAHNAAYLLLTAASTSAYTHVINPASQHYDANTTYAMTTSQSDFWIIGTSEEIANQANNDASNSQSALLAYGGYLDSGYGYGVSANILAPGVTNFCLPCNGLINPGVVTWNIQGVTATGQDSDLSTILNTPVWDADPNTPDLTVAEVMGQSNEGLRVLNADPFHEGTNSQYLTVFGAGFTEIFQGSGGVYATTMAGSQDTLVYESGSDNYVLTDADGQTFTFGNSFDEYGVGSGVTSQADAGGNTTAYDYEDGKVGTITQSTGANALERTQNTYVTGTSRLSTVLVQNSSNNGTTWTTLRQTEYTYYGAYDQGGPQDYLAVTTVKDGAGHLLEQTGYRYYASGTVKYDFGAASMARLAAAGLHLNTAADYSYYSSSDYELKWYADTYYEYDGQGRVSKRQSQGEGCSGCSGGLGTYTYMYATSGNSGSDLNNWTNKVVVKRIDETEYNKLYNTHTVYTNGKGQTLLEVEQSGGQSVLNYYRYDADGHQILHVNPSGLVNSGTLSYNESLADLVDFNAPSGSFIATTRGLFEWTDYYTASTATTTVAGAAAGYVKDTAVSQGQNGTKYYQSFTDYLKNTAGGRDYFQVADSVSFPQDVTSDPGTASTGARRTRYAYTWLQNGTNNTNQMASLTVTQPTVSSGNNGPGTADTSVSVFDAFGRTAWTKDADGFINYTAYDPVSGAVVKTITDVNTSQTSNFYGLPSGWAAPSTASALNLITTFSADGLGRTTQVTDPNGHVSYTIYDDAHHAVFSLSGASLTSSGTNGTLTATGPIAMSRDQLTYRYTQNWSNYAGSYAESLTFSGNLIVQVNDAANGLFTVPDAYWTGRYDYTYGQRTSDGALFNLTGSASITIQSLSRSLENAAGQTVESDAYFNIDNSTYLDTSSTSATSGLAAPFAGSSTANFYATTLGYDALGRQAHVVSPTGTITDTIFDGFGRVKATFVGTDDVPDYYNYNNDSVTDWEDFTYAMTSNLNATVADVNMTLVTQNQYDFGGVGDGNLTATIQYPGSGAVPRATQYLYDWRNRQIAAKSGVNASLPTGWSDADMGYPSFTGSVSYDGANFLVTGGGYGFGGPDGTWGYDYGHLVSTSVTGDTSLSAQVASQTALANNPQAGVMIRNSSDYGAMFAAVLVTPGEGVTFLWRSSEWYGPSTTSVAGLTGPVWVKLERSGNNFSGYYSTNGSSWTQIGSTQAISMNSGTLAGLAVSAHNYDGGWPDNLPAQTTAVFRNVSLKGTTVGAAAGETDNVHRPLTVQTMDNLGAILTSSRYDGDGIALADGNADGVPDGLDSSKLRARSTTSYDEHGRVFKTTTYSVSPTTGTYSTTTATVLISENWFNHRGEQIASYTSGGTMNKRVYDGAGRLKASYTTDGGAVNNGGVIRGTWADANSVSNDIVLSQIEYTYDLNGNQILTTDREAFHDNATTSTGALLGPNDTTGHAARVSYMLNYFDVANRLTESVNVGTNGGAANGTSSGGLNLTTIPSARTASTDTALVSFYRYDNAELSSSVIDPKGILTKTFYDNLGRTTKTVANYVDGVPSNSDDQTTLYTYDGANHILTLTADMPAGTNDQVTQYVFGQTSGSLISNDLLVAVRYPNKSTGAASTASSDQVLMTYDSVGETLTKRDQNLTLHTYGYDALGRQTSDGVSFPNGNSQNVNTSVLLQEASYNSQGLADTLTSYSNATGGTVNIVNQMQNVYNGFGQMTRQYQETTGAVNTSSTHTVLYAYSDAAHGSRLTSMTYPSGAVLNYDYGTTGSVDDIVSRTASLGQGTTTLESYKYLGINTVVQRQQGGGTTLTYIKQSGESNGDAGDQYTGLDRFGRVVDQRWLTNATSSNATFHVQYGYDRDSNRLYADNLVYQSYSHAYSYDNLNRLTSDQTGQLNSTKTNTTNWTMNSQTWTLDALGNPVAVGGLYSSVSPGPAVTNTVNSQNQITGQSLQSNAPPTEIADWFNSSSDSANWEQIGSGDAFNVNVTNSPGLNVTTVSADTINGHTESDARTVLLYGEELGPTTVVSAFHFPSGTTTGYAGIVFGYKSAEDYWMDVIDMSDNYRKVYHVINGNKGTPVLSNPHWEDIKDNLGSSGFPSVLGEDGPDNNAISGGGATGQVGLVTTIAGTKFDYVKFFPQQRNMDVAGRWDSYTISNNGETLFGAIDASDSALHVTTWGGRLLLKDLQLQKFQVTFRLSGSDTNAGLYFMFDATDEKHADLLSIPKHLGGWESAAAATCSGDIITQLNYGSNPLPSSAGSDWRWVRITDNGSSITLQCIDSNGSAPSEGDWASTASTYYTTSVFGFSGGRIGFLGQGASIVDDLTVKSYNDATSSWVPELVDTFTVNASGNAAQTLTYDSNGNLTYDGNQAYAYDAWNRLATVSHAYEDGSGVHAGQVFDTMGYDAAGRRITKTVTGTGVMDATSHFYYSGDALLETRNGSDRLLQQYVHGIGYVDELVAIGFTSNPATQTACDNRYFYQQDASYNVMGLTDTTGALVERYEYTAKGQRQVFYSTGSNDPAALTPRLYSQVSNSEGTLFNAFGYQGLWGDAETGLIYNRARYLDGELGFMSRDPDGYIDGANDRLDRAANPINLTDPTGLKKVVIGMEGNTFFGLGDQIAFDIWGPLVKADKDAEYWYYDQDAVSKAYADAKKWATTPITKDPKSGACTYNTIIITGFSNGGQGAIEVAQRLQKDGIQVNAALTADPVVKALQGFSFTKPANVTSWINYYEKGDAIGRLHGNSVAGATNTELVKSDFAAFASRYKGGVDDAYAHAHQNGLIVEQSLVIASLKNILSSTPSTRPDYKK